MFEDKGWSRRRGVRCELWSGEEECNGHQSRKKIYQANSDSTRFHGMCFALLSARWLRGRSCAHPPVMRRRRCGIAAFTPGMCRTGRRADGVPFGRLDSVI